MKKQNGFTLIELLVVVLIVGILSAVAVPMYQKSVENARATEALLLVRNIADANKRYFMANGQYTWDLAELDLAVVGDDASYANMKRKKSETFLYGARATSQTDTTGVIAIANRIPADKFYSLRIFEGDDRIYCRGYVDKGEKFCQNLTGSTTKVNKYYYVMK